ncbi:MAG: hypothetical protein ABI672_10685 [Vicinamibacteria bacterium]
MPIKSQAQRRKFAELLVEGKITPEVFERWNREAGSEELPEHVKTATAMPARKSKATAKPKATSVKKPAQPAKKRS